MKQISQMDKKIYSQGNSRFQIEPFSKMVEKPWGYEIILTRPELKMTGKILFIKTGGKLSLQYHEEKEESLCLFSGKAVIWLENSQGKIEKVPMELQKGYLILPNQKHRIEAEEDSFIFEASTPEKGTTHRIEDDYQRGMETEEGRENR